ncbi:nucleotidyltransferase domain-containing protein [Jeotgalibacillus proteolyticus]|uniref:nucleotidyltransferase domain-containing protein n=1 Tax=Jeotgalibacillus proteolyticus TaxID=2082395 RepID=UPI003CF0CA5B
MLIQEQAVEVITASLMKDSSVQAIFLKGSMGRGEHDEFSDIDLYVLVKEEEKEAFLSRRVSHLKAYGDILLLDEVWIIAPQMIAVYNDFLHIDLFTVTSKTFTERDYFKVLYDPFQLMPSFESTQSLERDYADFINDIHDTAWFLFQYKKSADRGNDIWSVRMLMNVMNHLSYVLLQKYAPHRAQLGQKTIETFLPKPLVEEIKEIFTCITPRKHSQAAMLISRLLEEEREWIASHLEDNSQLQCFLKEMIDRHNGK